MAYNCRHRTLTAFYTKHREILCLVFLYSQVKALTPALKDRPHSTCIKEAWNGKDQACSFLYAVCYRTLHSTCAQLYQLKTFHDIKSFKVHWAAFNLHKPEMSTKQCRQPSAKQGFCWCCSLPFVTQAHNPWEDAPSWAYRDLHQLKIEGFQLLLSRDVALSKPTAC